jgi:hypothetical protein
MEHEIGGNIYSDSLFDQTHSFKDKPPLTLTDTPPTLQRPYIFDSIVSMASDHSNRR